jgi:hypothetical protein
VTFGDDAAYDLDLATASLVSAGTDVGILLKVLATQLQEGFGDRVTVAREGGLFRKSDTIKSIDVDLGADVFQAEVTKSRVVCTIAHSSGGIRIRSEKVEMDVWVKRLLTALQSEAAHNETARQALENIIIGGPA